MANPKVFENNDFTSVNTFRTELYQQRTALLTIEKLINVLGVNP